MALQLGHCYLGSSAESRPISCDLPLKHRGSPGHHSAGDAHYFFIRRTSMELLLRSGTAPKAMILGSLKHKRPAPAMMGFV